ncbi:ATP-binding protein [Paraburkholderia panacisoli]|uniref:histidine kinase n=2 Tax=Paraburkholderia panacisoli TaxID=2603818 RepID=A0A5B0G5U6_9BURK|nr:ATP-binding protein [Paraburkholderia panacisoli]
MPHESDMVRLTQVLANLLTNAAKYSPDGSQIALSVVATPPGNTQVPGSVIFTVSDNGYGIPPEKLPYVFDMFAQLRAGSSADSGLGIGLALVRYLVECHGGSVSIESGGFRTGTTVTASLPVIEQLADVSAPPMRASA